MVVGSSSQREHRRSKFKSRWTKSTVSILLDIVAWKIAKRVGRVLGSGCGTVDITVASNTRGHGFEPSQRQLLLNIYLLLTVCRKDENKEKEAENGPFKKVQYLTINRHLAINWHLTINCVLGIRTREYAKQKWPPNYPNVCLHYKSVNTSRSLSHPEAMWQKRLYFVFDVHGLK